MFDITNINSVHFIGVGGISLSALAKLMLKWGKTVSGSDMNYSSNLIELMEKGAKVWIGSQPLEIDADLVVYSSAIPLDDKELVSCKNRNIPVMERRIFLGEVAKHFNIVIAISGTHGKTTCSGILSYIFQQAQKSFCSHIGGEVNGMGNLYYSGNDYFITEACEYKKSLLDIPAHICVVLNAERDHPDTFNDLSDVYQTFDLFLTKTKHRLGFVCCDTDYYKNHLKGHSRSLTFGIDKNAQFLITDVNEYKAGYYSFSLSHLENPVAHVKLNLAGFHNIYNAAAAIAVSYILKLDTETIKKGVENFQGVKRRFEKRGIIKGAEVFHDYAHHPSEIAAVIKSAKKLCKSRLILVFQPHTFSRTALLFNDFIDVLSQSDLLFLLKEYPARELASQGKSAYDLYINLKDKCDAKYFDKTLPLAKEIIKNARPFDLILVLGAGDIDKLCDILTDFPNEQQP